MLDELRGLALDLSWSWDFRLRGVFSALDPVLWEEVGHNPVLLLERLGPAGLEHALDRDSVRLALEQARRSPRPRAKAPPASGAAPLTVAYFSLEFGLTDCLPIYSGGLGVLAGDHMKESSELGLPLVGVGLLYRQGFFRQSLDQQGNQVELYPTNDFTKLPLERVADRSGPLVISCPTGLGPLSLAVWRARVGRVSLYLLDSDLEANPPLLRSVTDRLYAPEADRRLMQEYALGVGGMRALRRLGVEPTVFHLNEGHGFLVAVERMRELRSARLLSWEESRLVARAGIVFTTHTPVAAGSDYFSTEVIREHLSAYLEEAGLNVDTFMDLGRRQPGDTQEPLCTTYVGLRMADHSVGVSKLHGAVSRRLWKDAWPGLPEAQVPIGSVTNGVHLRSWVAPEIAAVLERWVSPRWWELDPVDPRWGHVQEIPSGDLWSTHLMLRRRLVGLANARWPKAALDPEVLTIGFSRRFAPYKRADLVFSNPGRLSALLRRSPGPIQFIFAGKAHPADQPGKSILTQVVGRARVGTGIAFLEDYSMDLAAGLVQGCDAWLNNPRRFLEASGTSGMKAGANGVLNLSILDGWWDEGYSPEVGWAIPSGATLDRPQPDDAAEAEALYRVLEREVAPAFYDRDPLGVPERWVAMMRSSILNIATRFSARRMVGDYLATCYLPAAERVEQLRLLPRWGG